MKTSEERKATPIATGVLAYFPKAMAAVARVSYKGNQKHNPGEPLHWSRGKSADHTDCVARHLVDHLENNFGREDENSEIHAVHMAWRALATAELALEALEWDERKAQVAGTWQDAVAGAVQEVTEKYHSRKSGARTK